MILELLLGFRRKLWHILCPFGLHSFILLYRQPRYLAENVLLFECKCGETKIRTNGKEFLEKESKRGAIYLIKY